MDVGVSYQGSDTKLNREYLLLFVIESFMEVDVSVQGAATTLTRESLALSHLWTCVCRPKGQLCP